MKTSSSASSIKNRRTNVVAGQGCGLPSRWPRAAFYFCLIVSVEIVGAYLITWIDPPRQATFVPMIVSDYQARPLAACVGGAEADFLNDGALFAETIRSGTTREAMVQTLDSLAKRVSQRPVVVYLSALALQADDGEVYLLPGDASPADTWTWLRLRDVLTKLKACSAQQKLLVLDFLPVVNSPRLGGVYHDIANAIPRELRNVPDADRWVLAACSPGQEPQVSPEKRQTIFAYYFQQALQGQADGYGDVKDGRVTMLELAGFVRNRVERWAWHNRRAEQTPMLFGAGEDFPLVAVDTVAVIKPATSSPDRVYPTWLLDGWKSRDDAFQQGHDRLVPRFFQQQQAILLAAEQSWHAGASAISLRQRWLEPCEQSCAMIQACAKEAPTIKSGNDAASDSATKTFDEWWRQLQQHIASAKAEEVESIKNRLIDELRAKLPPAELDAIAFHHALNDVHLDPGTIRLYDRLLHPTPQTTPRTALALRLRQLADLAMRVEVFAWPRDLVEATLRATELGEKAARQTPSLPNYDFLLNEPARNRHAGEVRLWTYGFTNLGESRQHLSVACEQFARLMTLDAEWRRDQQLLAQALAELPGYLPPLDKMQALREPWSMAVAEARKLDEQLRTRPEVKKTKQSWLEQMDQLTAQLAAAAPHALALKAHLQMLARPFSHDEIARMERKCLSPNADAETLQMGETILTMYGPALQANDRAGLWQATEILALRLHNETLALDRGEPDRHQSLLVEPKIAPLEDKHRQAIWRTQGQVMLLELAGVAEERLQPIRSCLERAKKERHPAMVWAELGAMLRRLLGELLPEDCRQAIHWQRRERLAWALPALEHFAKIDGVDTARAVQHARDAQRRQERWLGEQDRYLARDYAGLNLESQGIIAARNFYAKAAGPRDSAADDAFVRFKVLDGVEPLSIKNPFAHVWLELTRVVPAGEFGPLELLTHRPDDVWLDVSPEAASLSALRTAQHPRSLSNKVPLKVTRKLSADRTGLPAPAGLLVEARFDGRSYHHLILTPLTHDTREVQIVVSDDPKQPDAAINDISVRPGKMKQSFFIYVKNLTNRASKVHVDINVGDRTLLKTVAPIVLTPDGTHKATFEDTSLAVIGDLRGPLQIQVLDEDRRKVLETKMVRVGIMSPSEYVKVAAIGYEPGTEATNRFVAQLQSMKSVAGPAIAAELVLPARRIPGLLGVGGGTLQVELPTLVKSSRILSAEKIRIAGAGEEEGPVYFNIDGVPRAFVYRATFARGGIAPTPPRDERPAVRLGAPSCIMAGINYLVDIEVDNAPLDARLEVPLGRTIGPGGFKAEISREFPDARRQRINLETVKDALVFDASIQDWTATFDTRSIVGTRELRARLLTSNGKEIAQANQNVVIDNSPPLARLLAPTGPVKRGAFVPLQAQGADPESGVAQVFFFLGRPEKGEVPVTAIKIPATAVNLNFTLWSALVVVPSDQKGPLPVSVCVVNNAGMVSMDSVTIQVHDPEPAKIALGQIRGTVMEGPRPQPNLIVILTDEAGKELARTGTQADGSYVFNNVAPGRYRLLCVKPESQRRAVQGVIVEPKRTSRADLSLSL